MCPAGSRMGAAAATSSGLELLADDRVAVGPCAGDLVARAFEAECGELVLGEVAGEHAPGRRRGERGQRADAPRGMQRRGRRLREQRQHLRALPARRGARSRRARPRCRAGSRGRRRAACSRRSSTRVRRGAIRGGRRASRRPARRSRPRPASRRVRESWLLSEPTSAARRTTPRPSRAASGVASAARTSSPRASPVVPGFMRPATGRRAPWRGAPRTRRAPPRSRRRAAAGRSSRAARPRAPRSGRRGRAQPPRVQRSKLSVVATVGRQKHSRKRSSVCSAPKKWPPWPTSTWAPNARLSSSTSIGVNCRSMRSRISASATNFAGEVTRPPSSQPVDCQTTLAPAKNADCSVFIDS